MANTATLLSIHRLVWTALMAALIAVGAMISIPLGPLSPVPISLQTLFIMLAGLVLGPRGGALAVVLYLAAGCLGLPVFVGGKAGMAAFLGPTGGFLLGSVPAAMLCGFAGGVPLRPWFVMIFLCILGSGVMLLLGSLMLSSVLEVSIMKAFAVGALPFIPGEILKATAAATAYRFLAARRLVPTC